MICARPLVAAADRCGESPLWDARAERLYWLDLYRPTLHILDPATARHEAYPVIDTDLLACLVLNSAEALPTLISRDAIGRIEIDGESAAFRPDRCLKHADPREAFNDGKAHRSGAVWLGTADTEEEHGLGRLAVFRAGAAPVTVDGGFVVSNGPAFAPDGSVAYFSDSVGRRILRYPVDANGLPAGAGTTFVSFDPIDGNPDGMTVDADGYLWVAMWDGWSVRRISPDGRAVDRVMLSAPRVTSCAFGGPDLATLFITTAATGLNDAAVAAGAGGLFAVEPGVRGLAEPIARP